MTDQTVSTAVAQAWALFDVGRRTEAADRLARALPQQPDHAEALGLLALCYQPDDPARALTIVGRAVAAEPENPWLHTVRAWVLRNVAQARQGVAAAQAALRLNPSYGNAHSALAACLLDVAAGGDKSALERARRHADRAMALEPDNPYVHLLDGHVHQACRRYHDARTAFQRALAIQPDYPPAQQALAQWELDFGESDRAVGGFAAVLAARPSDSSEETVEDLERALVAWLWQRFFLVWRLMLAAVGLMILFAPPPLVRFAALIAALSWFSWDLRRSLRRLPAGIRRSLPRLLRRPRYLPALLLTVAMAAGLVAALTLPLTPHGLVGLLVVGLTVAVVAVARFLGQVDWPNLGRNLPAGWALAREQWRQTWQSWRPSRRAAGR